MRRRVLTALLFQGLQDDETVRAVLSPIHDRVKTGHVEATIDRLFTSRHLYDLRLISAVAFIIVGWNVVLSLLGAITDVAWSMQGGDTILLAALTSGIGAFLKIAGPTFVALFGVLTWAYQTGNARLGVMDLFACEIDTICRVVTITDLVNSLIQRLDATPTTQPRTGQTTVPPTDSRPFNSEEDYYPVLGSNVSDLQKLEARVVSHITEFYTFIKAFRDALRQRAAIAANGNSSPDVQRQAACNVIYSLYLALESGRHAIAQLVEFEPEQAERTLVILISELSAYHFLRQQFKVPREMRHERLTLRQPDYMKIVPILHTLVESHRAEVQRAKPIGKLAVDSELESPAYEMRLWAAAYQLLSELDCRYRKVAQLPLETAVLEVTCPSVGVPPPARTSDQNDDAQKTRHSEIPGEAPIDESGDKY